MTDDTVNPIVHVYLVRSIIPKSLVALSYIVSEKKGGHEKTEIGRISRPEVNFQKIKKPYLAYIITSLPCKSQRNLLRHL